MDQIKLLFFCKKYFFTSFYLHLISKLGPDSNTEKNSKHWRKHMQNFLRTPLIREFYRNADSSIHIYYKILHCNWNKRGHIVGNKTKSINFFSLSSHQKLKIQLSFFQKVSLQDHTFFVLVPKNSASPCLA